jgi:hypothetical protein
MSDYTIITEQMAQTLCLEGQGERCCSYMILTTEGRACAKGSNLFPMLAERHLMKTMGALGDNCSGPPSFIPNDERVAHS